MQYFVAFLLILVGKIGAGQFTSDEQLGPPGARQVDPEGDGATRRVGAKNASGRVHALSMIL